MVYHSVADLIRLPERTILLPLFFSHITNICLPKTTQNYYWFLWWWWCWCPAGIVFILQICPNNINERTIKIEMVKMGRLWFGSIHWSLLFEYKWMFAHSHSARIPVVLLYMRLSAPVISAWILWIGIGHSTGAPSPANFYEPNGYIHIYISEPGPAHQQQWFINHSVVRTLSVYVYVFCICLFFVKNWDRMVFSNCSEARRENVKIERPYE